MKVQMVHFINSSELVSYAQFDGDKIQYPPTYSCNEKNKLKRTVYLGKDKRKCTATTQGDRFKGISGDSIMDAGVTAVNPSAQRKQT